VPLVLLKPAQRHIDPVVWHMSRGETPKLGVPERALGNFMAGAAMRYGSVLMMPE